MTRKHFNALAAQLRALRPLQLSCDRSSSTYNECIGAIKQWEITCDVLGDFCSAQNPFFNRNKWNEAIKGEQQ